MHAASRLGTLLQLIHTLLIWLALAEAVAARSFTLERNTDRPGADIDRIEMGANGTREQCERACADSDFCQAYTWVPGAQPNDTQVCWLKGSVPEAKAASCCVSGVKDAAPRFKGSYEPETDLPGDDRARMVMPGGSIKDCRAACARDDGCVAYTMVAPGVQGPHAVCFLKDNVPTRVTKAKCCASGVKTRGFTVFDKKLDFDYPGNDYSSFDVPTGGRDVCEKSCRGDIDCLSYTYVKSSNQVPFGRCWLKGRSISGNDSNCCDSAIKRPGRHEMALTKAGTDMPGEDFQKIYLESSDTDPETLSTMCKDACGAEPKCNAFTFVRAGVQGNLPVCYLKSRVPKTARNDNCCSSGVRRTEFTTKPIPAGSAPSILYFSENDPNRIIEGLPFPRDMPDVRFPSGFKNCSDKERREIREAWAIAHYNIFRAHQIMQQIHNRGSERSRLWSYGFVDQMRANDDWANWSPRGWFGPYDGKRFQMARRAISKVFNERFRGRTFEVQCRGWDKADGWHPCATARSREPMANHIVLGKINFCSSFFEITTSRARRAQSIMHEIFHWLKIPDSIYWVTDSHDHWTSCLKYHAVKALYHEDAAKLAFKGGCRDWNHNRAVRVNDNYAWFITMAGTRIYSGGMRSFPSEDYK